MKLPVCNTVPDVSAESVLTALCPDTGAKSLTEASRTLNCKPWELKLWLIAHPRIEALVRCTLAAMLRDDARELLNWKTSGLELSAGQTLVRRMQSELLYRLAGRLEENVQCQSLVDLAQPAVLVHGATENDLVRRQGETLANWRERVFELYMRLQERCALAAAEHGRDVEVTGVGSDRMEITLAAIEQAEMWKNAHSGAMPRLHQSEST